MVTTRKKTKDWSVPYSKTKGKEIEKRLPKVGESKYARNKAKTKRGMPMYKISRQELQWLWNLRDEGLSCERIAKRFTAEHGRSITRALVGMILKESGYVKPTTPNCHIPVEYLFILRYDNKLTLEEIGKITELDPSTVHYHLNKPSNKDLYGKGRIFRENKSAILELKQLQMLEALNEFKVEAMDGKDLVNSVAKLEDKIRLGRGEATEIKTVESIDKSIKELDEEYKRIENSIIDITPVPDDAAFEGDAELEELNKEIKELEEKIE